MANAAGAVGGYLRVSLIVFPPEARTPEERSAFVDGLRQIRKVELQKEAAQQGETITEWYDDLGISGRGEFYPKRVAFSRARRDAKEGRLRSFYARDLSRLFRNVVQQELWFAEMEELGVTVHAQDLPFAADAATRRLLRQQMGIIHEYVSSRMGTMIRERTRTRLLSGLGVGPGRPQWGLRYNRDRKAYDFDPDTADRVRLVFETYVACGGVAGHAARQLNLLLAQGHPRSTPTPTGKLWESRLVLCQIRCSLYRRTIQYGDLLIPAPERIPAVVEPELVARADALLTPRKEFFAGVHAKRASGLKRFTYTGLLRCGYCGGPMRPRSSDYGVEEENIRWVSYQCNATSYNRGCAVQYSVQQRRIHRLVDRGIRKAFREVHDPFHSDSLHSDSLHSDRLLLPDAFLAAPTGPKPTDFEKAEHKPTDFEKASHAAAGATLVEATLSEAEATLSEAGSESFGSDYESFRSGFEMSGASAQISDAAAHALTEALGCLDRKRDRYLELFASGLIQTPQELARHLERVAQERHALEAPRTPEREVGRSATRLASAEEIAQLEADFLRVWPTDWARILDAEKQALLERLRASISIRILPHPTKLPGKTDRPRHNGGRLTLTLELPALGFAGQGSLNLAETDEDLRDYWQWRGPFVGRGDVDAASAPDGANPPDGNPPAVLLCRHCQSRKVFKGGHDQRGIQRFLCRDCKRSFHKAEDDRSRSHPAAFRAQVLAAYRERASMRVVCRTFHISHRTLAQWLKASQDEASQDTAANASDTHASDTHASDTHASDTHASDTHASDTHEVPSRGRTGIC